MKMAKKLASGVMCFAATAAAVAGRLPSGYAELEYIESTGTQYIDTGVTITSTMAVEADARFTEIVKQARIFGNLCGTGYLNFSVYINGAGSGNWASAMQDDVGDWVSANVVANKDRHVHKLDCTSSTRKYSLDGVDKGNAHPAVTKSTNGSLYLFASHDETTEYFASMRLYSCKIYDSGIVVHNYVPARRLSDSALGLYDLEAGSFLANAGTAEFLQGPEIPNPPTWSGDKPRTNGFEKTMEISIGEGMVSSVLTNFQVLVRLSETRQSGFHYADCGEKGADIRFTLPDGSLLAHEVDTWNTSGESLVWVNISNLTAATKFRMYWKPRQWVELPVVNPVSTWPKYAGVWHFNDTYPTNAADSSPNHYDAIATNATDTTQIDGKVGKTFHHASKTFFGIGIAPSLLGGIAHRQNFTISGWMKADSSNCGYARLAYKGGYNIPGWGVNMQDKATQITFRSSNSTSLYSPNCSSITSWQHFTCVYTFGGTVILYENGTLKGSASNRVWADESPGIELTLYADLVGSGDELRIRNGATSAEHAQADYKTQTDANFLSYGKVETQRAPGTAIYLI